MPWATPPTPRPAPQALLQGESGGRPLAFVLGARLSLQVGAREGAPPGSPSCQDPPTRGLGASSDPELRAFHSPHHSQASEGQDGACRTPTAGMRRLLPGW